MNFLSREEINCSLISYLTAFPQNGNLPCLSPVDHCRFLSLQEVSILFGFEAGDLGGYILRHPTRIPIQSFGEDIVFEREAILFWFINEANPLLLCQV